MGGLLNAIFGGGSKTEQVQTPDEISQQLNQLKLDQLSSLFSGAPLAQFASPRPSIYSPTFASQQLLNQAQPRGYGEWYDYVPRLASTDLSPFYTGQLERGFIDQGQKARDLASLQALTGFSSDRQPPTIQEAFSPTPPFLDFERYYSEGLGRAQDFLSKVATPQIMQQAALQGLERGGAVSEAIARAGAQISLPFLQSLPQASVTLGMAPTLRELQRAGIEQQRAGTEIARRQADLVGAQAGFTRGQTLQSIGGLLESLERLGLLRAQTGLTGAETGLTRARAGLTGAQTGLTGAQTGLTGAQTALTGAQTGLVGPQAGLLQAQRAATLFPLADYSRALQEQDLLRQQGIVTTGFTGIPFNPGGTLFGRQTTQPLFSFFGQG